MVAHWRHCQCAIQSRPVLD